MGLTDTQRRILEVGRRELLAKGFEGAFLRAIVKETGFTQGAFYGYYRSKEELFDALVAPAADGLMSRFAWARDAYFDLIPEGKVTEGSQMTAGYLRYFFGYL